MADDRACAALSRAFPAVAADSLKQAPQPILAKNALLIYEVSRCYPPFARPFGAPHESINRSVGEHVRGALHIKTVNSRHSRFKGLLRPFRGVSSNHLDSYLRWFQLVALDESSP